MMQSQRQHGSSGELDVFGATSYFAAGLPDDLPSKPAAFVTSMEDEQQLLAVANKQPSGKSSKLAALLGFVVSPSRRASFRKESPPPKSPAASKTMFLAAAAGDEPAKASSSSSSSRESSVQPLLLQGCGSVHELDLGVAMGDRRLQGIRVVRGGGGRGEERWVVRCSAWDEEDHHERMLLDGSESKSSDPSKDEVVEGGDGGWESDCSSDLFDLDLEYIC